MATKITTYNSIDERPTEKPNLRSFLPKAKLSLPSPFNRKSEQSESDLQKQCLGWLKTQKFYSTRVPLGGQIQRTGSGAILAANPLAGWPDLVALKKGVFIGIELKASGGSISRQQLNVLNDLQVNGADVFICTNFYSFQKIFDDQILWNEYNIKIENIKVI